MSVTIAKGSSDVPQWATDRARQIVQPGENILGIYVVSDENRKNAVKQPMACFLGETDGGSGDGEADGGGG